MPEFKDISTFNQVTPVGTERIQVSATNCVTLMDIANLGSETNWYTELDKRITQNKNDALAAYELANNRLPVSSASQEKVQAMMFNEEVNGNKVYAKSGWGWDVESQVGWLTGWVVKPNGKIVAFSLNMEMRKEIAAKRKEIAYQSLKQLGIL